MIRHPQVSPPGSQGGACGDPVLILQIGLSLSPCPLDGFRALPQVAFSKRCGLVRGISRALALLEEERKAQLLACE